MAILTETTQNSQQSLQQAGDTDGSLAANLEKLAMPTTESLSDSVIEADQENNDTASVASVRILPQTTGLLQERLPDYLELRQDHITGEGLFTKKALSVADTIFAIPYPRFTAIETEKLWSTCYSCLAVTCTHVPNINVPFPESASLDLKTCTGCHQVRFCGKACQIKAWHDYHRYECKIFKRAAGDFPQMAVRSVMRIVLLHEKGALPPAYWDTLMNNLATNPEYWRSIDPEDELSQVSETIKLKTKADMSVGTILKLFWVMRMNSIVLPTSVHGGVGMMLDPLFSKLNHRCDANTFLYRPAHTSLSAWNVQPNERVTTEQSNAFATVIPLRDIKAGEELTIFYSDPTAGVKERDAKHKFYCFQCSCPLCAKDRRTDERLVAAHPELCVEYQTWANDILMLLEQIQVGQLGRQEYDDAAKVFNSRQGQYLDHPDLYAASHFEQITIHLVYNGLKLGAFDKALINGLRACILIYSLRIPGRHNASILHMLFIVLETFDMLLGINCKAGTETPDPADIKQSLKAISRRGLSKDTLIYWRQRLCTDLRKRLEGTAAADLLPLVKQFQERLNATEGSSPDDKEKKDSTSSKLDSHAEQAMKKALQIPESRWKIVLSEAGM